MEKRELISLLAFGAIAVGLFVYGSNKNNTGAQVSNDTKSVVETVSVESQLSQNEEDYYSTNVDDTYGIASYKNNPEVKVFEPGEHVYMVRYDLERSPSSINGVSVNVPDGYEVLDIENYVSTSWHIDYTRTQTRGVDVWYINNEIVEVVPVYNDSFNSYDYSQPGKVIKIEEKEDISLGK